MPDPIQPGATLGVLGGGQLGRMFAIAARQMGYRVHVFVPEDDSPAAQVGDWQTVAEYNDLDRVAEFARRVDAITFEFENIASAATQAASQFAPVRPAGRVLHVTQHRVREKTFLRDAGLPVTPFAEVNSSADLVEALERLGLPAVLKTAAWGYDGKGQYLVHSVAEAQAAWDQMGGQQAVLEAFIDFQSEASVVAARSVDGTFAAYDLVENLHENHILDVTVSPATVSQATRRQADEIAREVMNRLEVVGVLCVEFFVTSGGELLINELAPRPHNSGHLTIDAHATSQFEQQVRAVCGLPLGSTGQLRPAAMANLLGEHWLDQPPNWAAALRHEGVKLHLYGKLEPRVGRKMGHLTALADTPDEARQLVLAARTALGQ
jgi:5-(carboxyamino)imidazole ribonucleotide synthase